MLLKYLTACRHIFIFRVWKCKWLEGSVNLQMFGRFNKSYADFQTRRNRQVVLPENRSIVSLTHWFEPEMQILFISHLLLYKYVQRDITSVLTTHKGHIQIRKHTHSFKVSVLNTFCSTHSMMSSGEAPRWPGASTHGRLLCEQHISTVYLESHATKRWNNYQYNNFAQLWNPVS